MYETYKHPDIIFYMDYGGEVYPTIQGIKGEPKPFVSVEELGD